MHTLRSCVLDCMKDFWWNLNGGCLWASLDLAGLNARLIFILDLAWLKQMGLFGLGGGGMRSTEYHSSSKCSRLLFQPKYIYNPCVRQRERVVKYKFKPLPRPWTACFVVYLWKIKIWKPSKMRPLETCVVWLYFDCLGNKNKDVIWFWLALFDINVSMSEFKLLLGGEINRWEHV